MRKIIEMVKASITERAIPVYILWTFLGILYIIVKAVEIWGGK